MIVAGIDYSSTSPAICVMNEGDKLENCAFLIFVKKELTIDPLPFKLKQVVIPKHLAKGCTEKYIFLAQFCTDFLLACNVGLIVQEDYSYASSGLVFHIGENAGILKAFLLANGLKEKFELRTPPVFKKFATGRGNCDKKMMYDSFYADTDCDLMKMLGRKSINSPINDMVDAYWIAKYGTTLNNI